MLLLLIGPDGKVIKDTEKRCHLKALQLPKLKKKIIGNYAVQEAKDLNNYEQ